MHLSSTCPWAMAFNLEPIGFHLGFQWMPHINHRTTAPPLSIRSSFLFFSKKKMNQISSRFSVCCRSSSLLRKNPFTRSSKPISSSSFSSNLIKVFTSKLRHQTFNYPSPPPQIPGNHHFRKFSGEASECNFRDDDYLKNEILKLQHEQYSVPRSIELGYGPSVDGHAVEILADKFNALMEKLGLPTLDDNEKEAGDENDYPDHLQRFRKEIQELVESVEMTVAYGEFVAAGGENRWSHFEENYECMLNYHNIVASLKQMKIRSRLMRELIGNPSPSQIPGNHGAGGSNFVDEDYVKYEIWSLPAEYVGAQSDVELGIEDPLDAVQVLADRFNAFMEKLGLETLDDDEHDGDYPQHLHKYRQEIEDLEYQVDMTVAFGEYVAAGGSRGWHPFRDNYRCMIKYEEILASLQKMKISTRLMRRLIKVESDFQSTVVVMEKSDF